MPTKDEDAEKRLMIGKLLADISGASLTIDKGVSDVFELCGRLSEVGRGLDTYHDVDGARFSRWEIVVDGIRQMVGEIQSYAESIREYADDQGSNLSEPPRPHWSDETLAKARAKKRLQ